MGKQMNSRRAVKKQRRSGKVAGPSIARLAVIGAGNMAQAIVGGALRARALKPRQVVAADVAPERREFFKDRLKVRAIADNAAAVRGAAVVLMSVKPQTMAEALDSIAAALSGDALIISIAAGVPTRAIESRLGPTARVVRAMPNTPMLIGQGIVALASGSRATPADLATAQRLFSATALVVRVPEELMDAVTAVSGSGPAYIFYLVEQMTRAGIELGLAPDIAKKLATVTAAGAGAMLIGDEDPAELRRRVTSPGGTTQAAIELMESRGLDKIVRDAIAAAEKRGKELGKTLPSTR
jgi:pyrroline-5-carboxylate reductase